MRNYFALFILILGAILVFPQQTTPQKELLKRANENYKLLFTNSEKAFQEAKKIEKVAKQVNAKEAELRALTTQNLYYKTKNDFDNVTINANLLFQKAKSYENSIYQTIAKTRLFDAYAYNKLYEKAFEELEQGTQIINKTDGKDSLVISTKSDLYIAYINYYLSQNEPENQLKYIKLSILEHEKFHNEEHREKLLFLDYSNLSVIYYISIIRQFPLGLNGGLTQFLVLNPF